MALRTSWVADAVGQGLTYGTLINTGDMASMTSGQAVLSSVATITNGTALAQFMDISFKLVISSNTIAAGANFAFFIFNLNQDASTLGDGSLTAGTAGTFVSQIPPAAVVGLPTGTQTNLWGTATGIIIPPGSFRVVIQNNSGFALTAGTQTVQYRTYNINLNA